MSNDGPTTIQMIYDSQTRMEGKMDTVETCVTGVKVEQGKQDIRIRTLERERKEDKEVVREHFNDKKVHYNAELADEGVRARLWRKKLEIAIIIALGGIVTTGGAMAIRWLQTMGGP